MFPAFVSSPESLSSTHNLISPSPRIVSPNLDVWVSTKTTTAEIDGEEGAGVDLTCGMGVQLKPQIFWKIFRY